MRFVRVILTLGLLAHCMLAQEPARSEMVTAALAKPNDEQVVAKVIRALNQNSDLGLITPLAQVFERSTAKRVRQFIALTLLLHGQSDEVYLNELLKFAREAITTTAPRPYEDDEQGNSIKGRRRMEFDQWCERNALQISRCLEMVGDHPLDVLWLAQAKDRRAIPVLRQGLSVENPVTVEMAVRGLAWLSDTDSIPLIATNLLRFRPQRAQAIAAAMADFDDTRVAPLLDRFVTNRKWRQELDEAIQKRRAAPR